MAAVILTMAAGSLAGPYVTTAVGYYRAGIGGQLPSHGVILNAGATVDFFISTLNVLYVPDRKPAISACHCRHPWAGWMLMRARCVRVGQSRTLPSGPHNGCRMSRSASRT